MKRLALFLCAAALAATAASPAFADTVVFNQPLDTNLYTSDNWISESSPAGFVQVFDHFSVAQNTTVSSIEWSGLVAEKLPLGDFQIAVYNNINGYPGFLLYSQNAGSGNPVALFNIPQFTIDQFSASTNLALTAGTGYWFTVYTTDATAGSWAWLNSQYGDKGALDYIPDHWFGDGPGTSPLHDNLAFTMYGSPTVVMPPPPAVTPEPSSLIFMGSGMLTMAGMVRRRLASRHTNQQ